MRAINCCQADLMSAMSGASYRFGERDLSVTGREQQLSDLHCRPEADADG
jgi:hypothetical protein